MYLKNTKILITFTSLSVWFAKDKLWSRNDLSDSHPHHVVSESSGTGEMNVTHHLATGGLPTKMCNPNGSICLVKISLKQGFIAITGNELHRIIVLSEQTTYFIPFLSSL